MRIFIEPTEPLLFRTGRPFNAGEDNFAESVFPPTPETLQGALRAAIAVQWGQQQSPPKTSLSEIFEDSKLKELIGDYNTYGRLRITGLSLGRRRKQDRTVERLFPAPAHIIHASSGNEKQLVYLEPQKKKLGTTNVPDELYSERDDSGYYLLYPQQKLNMQEKAEELKGWLTPRGLQAVLRGEILVDSDDHLVKADQIYIRESRLGIGIDSQKQATKEGYLYQVQMIRMRQDGDFAYGFVVDLELGEKRNGDRKVEMPVSEQREDARDKLSFLQEGWLTLGGEQRPARFKVLKPEEIAQEPDSRQNGSRNFLYFATPAYFKGGWLPNIPDTLTVKPITAAINRYQTIGGWALEPGHAGGQSKLARRCIPAGSVYFFDHSIHVTKPVTEYGWQIGYGITLTGEW
ncbi:MAG TPA: type III-B CRISPR module-associated protein Cmr3 [Ktedonobacteraceae bacterium]|jgi:CRISPR-associated protein Cmr3